MNETFRCGDQEALVAYLYDECDPADRDAIAAHVARCASCAEELGALQATRSVLATWTPPETALGFRITGPEAEQRPASVLRPAAWWRQPLPAWAQAAAALLIFAAGLTLGGARTAPTPVASAPAEPRAASAPVTVRTSDVSREDLARVERRLRAIEAAAQGRATPPAAPLRVAAPADENAVLERVASMLAASEDRQRRESIALMANFAREFETQRRVDLRQVEDRLSRIQGTTGVELQQQRDALNYFVRTSLSGAR